MEEDHDRDGFTNVARIAGVKTVRTFVDPALRRLGYVLSWSLVDRDQGRMSHNMLTILALKGAAYDQHKATARYQGT